MNSELKNIRKPFRLRSYWFLVYLILVIAAVSVVFVAAEQAETHILPVGQVKLTVPYSKYIVGEKISYTIKNSYNSSIYIINNCPSEPLAVYRFENNKWVRQHDQTTQGECAGQQRQISVEPGGSITGNFSPWHNLFKKPGKYRVVVAVEHYNSLPYQDFEVVAVGAAALNDQLTTDAVIPDSSSEQTASTNPTTNTTTEKKTTTTSTPTTTNSVTSTDEPDSGEESDD